jgi:hypothetical protein
MFIFLPVYVRQLVTSNSFPLARGHFWKSPSALPVNVTGHPQSRGKSHTRPFRSNVSCSRAIPSVHSRGVFLECRGSRGNFTCLDWWSAYFGKKKKKEFRLFQPTVPGVVLQKQELNYILLLLDCLQSGCYLACCFQPLCEPIFTDNSSTRNSVPLSRTIKSCWVIYYIPIVPTPLTRARHCIQ